MIITKIEIEQFGKWKNFTLDFSAGTNVILGKNEAGKSTLCDFLGAMFYGLPNESKRRGLRENLRKRYLPWGGGQMAGSVHFTAEGKSYILSRRFGSTQRSDKLTLRDGVTWEECTDIPPDELGRTFLGVGEDGFFKTLYIRQLGAAIAPSGDDEILKRLSNLGQTGDEEISYQAASSALEKASYALLSKGKRAGLLLALEEKKDQLELELAETKRLSDQFQRDIRTRADMEREGERLAQEQESLVKQRAFAKAYARYNAFKKNEEERRILSERIEKNACDRKDQAEKTTALRERMKQFRALEGFSQTELLELARTEKEIADLTEQLEAAQQTKERLSALEREREERKRSKKSGVSIPMLLVAVLVAAIGVVFGVLVSPVLFLLPVVGLLLSLVACMGLRENKKQKQELDELERKIAVASDDAKQTEPDAVREKLAALRDKLNTVLSANSVPDVQTLSERLEEKLRCEQEWKAAENALALLENTAKQLQEDLLRLPPKQQPDFPPEAALYSGPPEEELDALLAANHRAQLENQSAYEAVRHRIENAFSGARSADVIMSELEQTEEKISQYEFHYGAVELARNILEESYAELKKNFAPVLNRRVGEILGELTEGAYNELTVTDDYKVFIREKVSDEIVDAEYLSSGAYDLLYFALRMGIAQTILPDRLPILVLDDAFLQLDDKRAAAAAEFLQTCGAEQILYFTCHETQTALFAPGTNLIRL